MKWNVICHTGDDAPAIEKIDGEDEVIHLRLDVKSGKQQASNLYPQLKQTGQTLNIESLEFFWLAFAVLSADRQAMRTHGYLRWVRDFTLQFPVHSVDLWDAVREPLMEALSFLTGDRWTLVFRETKTEYYQEEKTSATPRQDIPIVSLLSGGLDSFIGAIDLLQNETSRIAFVSRYGQGGVESTSQKDLLKVLAKDYPDRFHKFRFYAQPETVDKGDPKLTSRSRSIVYLALAVVVGSTLNSQTLIVPENGFISLNIPMGADRIGGYSSRTTHPYFLHLVENVLGGLGINLNIQNPYRFSTKGEMLLKVANNDVLREGISLTMSCSHTSRQRYEGISTRKHCGYCLPCLVRRAALYKAGLGQDDYVVDMPTALAQPDTVKGKDVRSLVLAVTRWLSSDVNPLFTVTGSSTLPDSDEAIKEFVGVYNRGMQEFYEYFHQFQIW